MIVRNVEKTIEPCLRSVAHHVDEFVIVDTGSSDRTKANIRTLLPGRNVRILDFTPETHPEGFLLDSAEFYEKELAPFTNKKFLGDFAAARQFGWQIAKSDYLLWIDSDDIVTGADKLPSLIEDMATGGFDTGFLNYDYNTDAQGRVTLQHTRERIFKRTSGAAWVGKVHEVCIPPGATKVYFDVNIVHKRREYGITPEVANRNLKILFPWLKEQEAAGDVDPRILYYLATEERFIWPERALVDLRRYASMSGSSDERALSYLYAGKIYEQTNRIDEAFGEYAKAGMSNPANADAFFNAARILYYKALKNQANWHEVIDKTERGFAMMDAFSMMTKDPTARISEPYIYYSRALINTHQYKKAIEACDEGMKHYAPDSKEYGWLAGNRKSSVEALNPSKHHVTFKRNESLDAPPQDVPGDVLQFMAIQIWKRLRESGDDERAKRFLDSLPREYAWGNTIPDRQATPITPVAPAMWKATSPEVPEILASAHHPEKLNIVIWTGPAWEKWSPKNLETGLGGSELACIYMARELAHLGHNVRVYSDCGDEAGLYDGVEYVRFTEGSWFNASVDVLIVSRNASFLKQNGGDAKLKILWAHDVHCGSGQAAEDGVNAADVIFCLSEWHKDYFSSVYPSLNKNKIVVTRNGIDPTRFDAHPAKIGNRLIYASSPDRGLDRLLDLFPRIRAQVRNAKLHVYYGFVTWKKMAEMGRNAHAQATIEQFERRLAETEGVFSHGRVGQKELAEAFMASKVWAYPTNFTETSCISAMEAQAAGCVPVTTALAALNETVKYGTLIDPPNTSDAYADKFVNSVVTILRNHESHTYKRAPGRAFYSPDISWTSVAREWEALFLKTLGREVSKQIESNLATGIYGKFSESPVSPRIEIGKPKLIFVHEADDNWRDGLYAAMKLLESDFDIGWVNLAKGHQIPGSAERLLAWGAFDSNVERACRSVKAEKKFLQMGGVATAPNDEYDVIFAETNWHLKQLVEKLSGRPTSRAIRLVRAFGTNTDIYKDLKLPKVYDWITVGALASWKRLERFADPKLIGSRLAIVQPQPNNRAESDPILANLLDNGVQIVRFGEPEALAQFYNMSKACYIPADINGGGERAVLEARACGLPVFVQEDNPKLAELRDEPLLDHHAFAATLKDGMLESEKPISVTTPAEISNGPKVSVLIIMARPGGVDITFAGLRDQTYKNFETIIVDSRYEKRHEKILKMAEDYGLKDVIHVPEHRRNGKWIVACAAFNTAIALARGDIVIILHDFIYTPPGWIESHVKAHGDALKRHVVGNHQNVDLPELTVALPHHYETDRAIVNHDAAFESLDELCIFKNGPFDPSWPAVVGPKQWQPVFSSWFHAGKKPGRYWVTLTNDSFRREFLWDLGGINERFDHGRGPSDMELSARVHAAGGETVYVDEPNPPLFNPRFVMRSLAFGNHKENFQHNGTEERWTEVDGVAHWKHVERSGITKAPNPFDMRELAARLEPWREEGPMTKRIPLDISNTAYFRRRLRPTDE